MNHEITDEKEINLIELCNYILRQWRFIIVSILTAAVLLGAYSFYRHTRSQNRIKAQQELSAIYTPQMNYDTMKRSLEQEIKSLHDSIQNSENYSRDSLLMNLDPYHVYESTADIYIKTDYEIQPDKAYQSPDYTSSVVSSYKLLVLKDDVLEEISERFNIDPLYLQELIDVTEEINTKMIHLKVIHSEQEICDNILSFLLERIQHKKTDIESQIGPHTLNIIQQSTRETIRKDIADKQKQQVTTLQEYQVSLTKKEDELAALSNPLSNDSRIVSSFLKYTLMGGMLGCFLSCFILSIRFINEDKLISEEELKRLYHFKILGLIEDISPSPFVPRNPFSRLGAYLDFRINKLFYQKPLLSKDVIYEMIASDILKSQEENTRLILLGCAGSQIKSKVAADLKNQISIDGLNICIGNGFDSNTVKNLSDCPFVLLIEQYNHSTLTSISQELEVIGNMNKILLGCVITK